MTSGFAISNPPSTEMGVPIEHAHIGPCQHFQNICTGGLPWNFSSLADHTTPALQFFSFDTYENGEDNHMYGKVKPQPPTFPRKTFTPERHL
jgi:hypothetical protein